MTAIPPTPGMEVTFFYQASQLFAECMSAFMKQRIREHFKAGADAQFAKIQAEYVAMNQMVRDAGTAPWDVSFVLYLWVSDALLRPSTQGAPDVHARVEDADVARAEDNAVSDENTEHANVPVVVPPQPPPGVLVRGYQPKMFAIDNQFRGNVFAGQSYDRLVMVETSGYKVHVLHSRHVFAFDGIRNVRNRWAHSHPVSIATYLRVIDAMYSLVRSLPRQFVSTANHNQFNYLLVNMRQLADVANEREKIIQEKERLDQERIQAETEKKALQAEMQQAQQRITELSETLAKLHTFQHEARTHQEAHQAEQQLLVQALLSHLTNTTYHTNTTIDALQDQVHRMQQTDRDDLLLATIVQLQQVVVEQRHTIGVLQHNLTALDEGLQQMTRTKPIDPATVPTYEPDVGGIGDPPPPLVPPLVSPVLAARWQAIWMLVLTIATAACLWAWSTGLIATWSGWRF